MAFPHFLSLFLGSLSCLSARVEEGCLLFPFLPATYPLNSPDDLGPGGEGLLRDGAPQPH